MSRTDPMTTLRTIACAVALGAMTAATAGCDTEVRAEYPAGYDGDYPPDTYIATAEPVYYEGNATYWYGGYWYYRNGGRWSHYGREPAGLYQRRMQGGFGVRRNYEGHGGGRGGGHYGGGRGGGRR